jgi:hypothetical protein
LSAVKSAGISGVALRDVDEIRPVRGDTPTSVVVGPTKWVELYAYAGGMVHAARLAGASGDEIEATLKAAGLTVRRRSGNIG